jgi:homoserine kinase
MGVWFAEDHDNAFWAEFNARMEYSRRYDPEYKKAVYEAKRALLERLWARRFEVEATINNQDHLAMLIRDIDQMQGELYAMEMAQEVSEPERKKRKIEKEVVEEKEEVDVLAMVAGWFKSDPC